jgi:hypothetical protein
MEGFGEAKPLRIPVSRLSGRLSRPDRREKEILAGDRLTRDINGDAGAQLRF